VTQIAEVSGNMSVDRELARCGKWRAPVRRFIFEKPAQRGRLIDY
jgi:hypothetical protein